MIVLYEGLPDEVLMKRLGVRSTKDGRHKSGVLKDLIRKEGRIGLVDEDPKNTQSRPKIMNEFQLINKKHAIKHYYHQSNKNLLIVL